MNNLLSSLQFLRSPATFCPYYAIIQNHSRANRGRKVTSMQMSFFYQSMGGLLSVSLGEQELFKKLFNNLLSEICSIIH